MSKKSGTVLEPVGTPPGTALQTYLITFRGGTAEVRVQGRFVEGQPIILHATEDCAIYIHKPVFEHDLYWLPKEKDIEVLPLHGDAEFEILRPVQTEIVEPKRTDPPRIPTGT